MVEDGFGGALVYWEDYRDPAEENLLAQHLLPDGNVGLGWDLNGNFVSSAPNNQQSAAAADCGAGQVVFSWYDLRAGAAIYGQGIAVDGHFGRPSPLIATIADVPNDQGGSVKVRWDNTFMEQSYGSGAVTEYWVLRSSPDRNHAQSVAELKVNEARMVAVPLGNGVEYWEFVVALPAFHQRGYSFVASTTSDSLSGSNPYTKFMIMARNADGSQYYFSNPDSGYSVDNLSPPTPSPFTARYDGLSVALHWTPSRAADFKEYRVYRGPTVSFVPGPQYLVSATPDTGIVDHPPLGAGDVYKLVAVDIHGNASKYAVVTPSSPVSALAALVSADWQDDAAQLVWYGGALALTQVTVLRDEDGAGWTDVATITGDGEGMVRFADAAVLPGHRYGYKLRFNESGVERFAGEAYILIPAGRLAIQAVAPNPVMSNRLRLRASLAQSGPARVRVLDLAGRVVRDQEAPTNLTGAFEMSLDGGAPLRPGVYIVELRQGTARATTRFTYLR